MIPRLSRRERTYLGTAIGAAAVLAALGLGLSQLERTPEPPGAPARAVSATPPAAQTAALPQPDPADKVQERAGPAAAVQAQQVLDLEPPYSIIDGLTFASGPLTIRLSGLEGPPARAACRDESRNAWACGLQARAALNNHTRKRRLACTVTGASAQDVIDARCQVEGEGDLGRALVESGWARPLNPSPDSYLVAFDEARRDKRGLWNGDWTVTDPGPVQDVSVDPARALDLRPTQAGD